MNKKEKEKKKQKKDWKRIKTPKPRQKATRPAPYTGEHPQGCKSSSRPTFNLSFKNGIIFTKTYWHVKASKV